MTSLRRARGALIAALLVPALLLSGCGAGSDEEPKAEPSTDLPQGDVEVPDGVTLTKAGSTLAFKQLAYVPFQPNSQRSSVLALTVDSVQAGRIADFAAYQLDDRTKKSRPFYVQVSARNVGTGDLSGTGVPLFAVNNANALVQPSSFTSNTFKRCPSATFPAGFTAGKSFQTCLVYMVPDGGTLVEMSFRPLQAFEPITWRGAVAPATNPKKADQKAGKKGQKKPRAKAQP